MNRATEPPISRKMLGISAVFYGVMYVLILSVCYILHAAHNSKNSGASTYNIISLGLLVTSSLVALTQINALGNIFIGFLGYLAAVVFWINFSFITDSMNYNIAYPLILTRDFFLMLVFSAQLFDPGIPRMKKNDIGYIIMIECLLVTYVVLLCIPFPNTNLLFTSYGMIAYRVSITAIVYIKLIVMREELSHIYSWDQFCFMGCAFFYNASDFSLLMYLVPLLIMTVIAFRHSPVATEKKQPQYENLNWFSLEDEEEQNQSIVTMEDRVSDIEEEEEEKTTETRPVESTQQQQNQPVTNPPEPPQQPIQENTSKSYFNQYEPVTNVPHNKYEVEYEKKPVAPPETEIKVPQNLSKFLDFGGGTDLV